MRTGLLLSPFDSPDRVASVAGDAHAAGAHSVWTGQRPGGWDALTLLTALQGTVPAELGTGVVPTYPRHPVALATEALTVQAITGGRLTLGIGPSHEWYMSGQLGLPYTAPAAHTREYLEVLRPLLRGEHVRHSGRFFTVDTRLELDAPAPPVLLSALGPRMLRAARELTDGTIAVWVRPDTVADHLVPSLKPGARVVVFVTVAVTHDPEGAREAMARDFAQVRTMPAYRAVLERGGIEGAEDTLVAGDEEHVAAQLRRFADAGATDLVVSPKGTTQEQERAMAVALDR